MKTFKYAVYTKTLGMGSGYGGLTNDLEEAKKFAKTGGDKFVIYREVFEGEFFMGYFGKPQRKGGVPQKSVKRYKNG